MRERDPLDFAIADEPIPDELRDDEEFTAEYSKARDDLDLIRRGLGELASLTPPAASSDRTAKSVGARPPLVRNPGRILLAAAAVVLVLVGGTYIVQSTQNPGSPTSAAKSSGDSPVKAPASQNDSGAGSSGGEEAEPRAAKPGASPSPSGETYRRDNSESKTLQDYHASVISCAKLVAVGRVTSTQRIAGGRAIVEFAVSRQVLPLAANPRPLKLEVADPGPWRVDREALVILDRSPQREPVAVWLDTDSTLAGEYEKLAARSGQAPCSR